MLRILQITAAILLEAFALFMTMLVCILMGSLALIAGLATMTVCIELMKSAFLSISNDQWKNILETYY